MKPKHPQSRWRLAAVFFCCAILAAGTLPLVAASPGSSFTKTTVVGWGDSLTYGTGGIATTGETRSWPWWFTQISGGLTVINKGVGGEPTSSIRTRMLAEPALHDHFTVIWAGRNNVGGFSTNMSYAEADIAAMVAALPPTTKYLVLGVINSDSEPSGSTALNNINLFNSHLAATYGQHYVDIRPILVESYDPSLPQDVINHAGDMPPASLLSDGLHLKPAGYEVVGAAIYKAFLTLAAPERGTWTGGGGTNNWKESANWSVGPYSGNTDGFSSTETAIFGTAGGGIVDLSGTVNVKTLAFGSRGEGAGAFTVGKSGDALNLASGGGVSAGSLVRVDETVGNSAGMINLSDTANSTTFFSNNGQSILTIASPINSTQDAGNTSTLTLGGCGDGIITGSLKGGGAAGSDALSIVKRGTGTWTLSGQSLVSGTVGIYGGKLVVDGATNGTLISPIGISNGEASFKGDSSGATSVSLPNLVMGVQSATANTLTLASNEGSGVNLSVASYSNAKSTLLSNLIDISSSPGNSVVIGSLGEGAFRPLSSGVLMSGSAGGSARAVTIVKKDGRYGFATISSTTNGALGCLAPETALGAGNASTTADYRLDGERTLVRSANLNFSTLTIDSSAGNIVLDMGTFTLSPTSYGCGVLIAGNHNVSIQGSGVATARFYNYSTGTFSMSLASSTFLFIGGTGFTDYSGTIPASTAGGTGIVVAQGTFRISREQDLAITAPTKFLLTGGGVLEIGADLNGEAAGDFSYAINTSSLTKVIRFYGDSGISASGGNRVVNFNGDSTPKTYTWGSSYFLTDTDGATDGGYTFKLSSVKSDSTIEIKNPIILGANTNRRVDVANGSAAIDAVLSGELRGSGASLIKSGEGTLSLRAKNIYSGATVVNAGCLFIEGALSHTSAVDVASGAEVRVNGNVNQDCTTSVRGTLRGSGTIGTVVIESGGILSHDDLIGPLTADSVSFATGGVFSIKVEGASQGSSDQLSVVGNLNITHAALNLTVLTPLNDPVYILATYGSLTGTFASVTGLPAGYVLDYAYNGGTQIALVSGYSAWTASFGSGFTDTSPASDPDFDSLSNLIEYAFGTDPTTPTSSSHLPQPVIHDGQWQVSYTVPFAAIDLIYGAEWSGDLVSWTPLADSGSGTTHTFSVSMAGRNKIFFRHKITRLP